MPILELADGTMLNQSVSIHRYVAKKMGYYPQDAVEACKVDMIVDIISDKFMGIAGPVFAPAEQKEEKV